MTNLANHEKVEFSHIEYNRKNDFKVGNKTYAGLWRRPSGQKGIDSQVIALGKMRKWVVVSNDSSVKWACTIEGIECISREEAEGKIEAKDKGCVSAIIYASG